MPTPKLRAAKARIRLAADIGGTFTDIAVFDDRTGALTFGKALSMPSVRQSAWVPITPAAGPDSSIRTQWVCACSAS